MLITQASGFLIVPEGRYSMGSVGSFNSRFCLPWQVTQIYEGWWIPISFQLLAGLHLTLYILNQNFENLKSNSINVLRVKLASIFRLVIWFQLSLQFCLIILSYFISLTMSLKGIFFYISSGSFSCSWQEALYEHLVISSIKIEVRFFINFRQFFPF